MGRILVLLVALSLIPRDVHAAPQSGAASAAAESLYREANQFAADGQFERACPKYEASLKLDRALGTMLRLADCWDRVGRTASAWALFLESASWAAKSDELEREAIARKRAEALESRLTRISLKADFELPKGYQVKVAGTVVEAEVWGTPIPVDPGELALEASAPGYELRRVQLEISPAQKPVEVSVPELKAKLESKEPTAVSGASSKKNAARWVRPTGIAVAGLGLAGVAAGATFGILAKAKNDASLANCTVSDPNLCSGEGVQQRNQAQAFARGANIAMAVGGGLLGTGLLMIILAPRSDKEGSHASLRLTPVITTRGGAAMLRGEF